MALEIIKKLKTDKDEHVAAAQEEAPHFEKVIWYRDPGLRQLYFYAFVLCIASATTGYDGSVTTPHLLQREATLENHPLCLLVADLCFKDPSSMLFRTSMSGRSSSTTPAARSSVF